MIRQVSLCIFVKLEAAVQDKLTKQEKLYVFYIIVCKSIFQNWLKKLDLLYKKGNEN